MDYNNIKKDTIFGLKWSLIENFSVQIVTFILGLIMARLLEPSDFGIIGMLSIFFAIAQSLVDSGFSNALIRKSDRTEKDFSTVFFFNIAIGVLCYIILYISAPYITSFFKIPLLTDIVRYLSIIVIINSFATVQIAKLTIEINFKTQAKASFIAAIIGGICGIYMAYIGYGVWAIVLQMIISRTIIVIILWYSTKWKPMLCFSKSSFTPLFSYGSKLMLSGIIQTLYSNITTLLIGKVYSPEVLGFYTRGSHIANLPSRNVTNVLQRVTFPILSKIQNDDDKLISVYRKYICLTSLCIIFGMTLLATEAQPIIIILLTDKWAPSIIYLQIFCFVMMFDHINLLNLNLLQVKGRSDLCLKLQIIKKTISFILLLIAIPYGAIAVCSILIIYVQIAIIINTYYTGKIFKLGYFKQLKDFSRYFIFSISACIPAYIITHLIKNPWVNLLFGSIISIFIYIFLLRKDKYMLELLKTIQISYIKLCTLRKK